MGHERRFRVPYPILLPRILYGRPDPQVWPRFREVREEVWQGLGRVLPPSAVQVHSGYLLDHIIPLYRRRDSRRNGSAFPTRLSDNNHLR